MNSNVSKLLTTIATLLLLASISLAKSEDQIKRHLTNYQLHSPIKAYFDYNRSSCRGQFNFSVANKTILLSIRPSQNVSWNRNNSQNCAILPTSVVGKVTNNSQSYVDGIVTNHGEFYGKIAIGRGKFTKIYYVDSWFSDHDDERYALIYSFADLIPYQYRSGTARYGILTESIENLDKYLATDQDLSLLEEDSDEMFIQSKVSPNRLDDSPLNWKSGPLQVKKKICKLLAISDASFTVSYHNNKPVIEAALWNIVLAGNKLIQSLSVDDDHYIRDEIEFQLDSVQIEEPDWYVNDAGQEDSSDPMEYLLQRSRLNYNDYCLVIVLTNREFTNHENSISWTHGTKNFGLCSPYQQHPTVQEMISGNVMIISRKSLNSTLPQAMIENEFIQELAIATGLWHEDRECLDKSTTKAILAQTNPCDKQSILTTLRDRLNTCSRKQLLDVNVASNQCGNGRIQPGEECDCGAKEDCSDSCCDAETCKLITSSQCSPSQGPCCNPDSCMFYNVSEEIACLHEEECYHSSLCDGKTHGSVCPPPKTKPDSTLCEGNRKTCQNGECSGSLCLQYGRQACECQVKEKSCHLCCWNENTKTCQSISDYPEYDKLPGMYKPEGSNCGNGSGICNWDGHCIPPVRIGASFISVILRKLLRYLGRALLAAMLAFLATTLLIYYMLYNEPFFFALLFLTSVGFGYFLNKKLFTTCQSAKDEDQNSEERLRV
ncbi:Disintegrin and metalloproteinase domain-containing protein 10 [Trichoplax sp. H2]|nr:Disintegrin and metalloproteinase domain-containing protein 10 [Trichoplax sp. H2]|eukprot:RDD37883.1 Disintegrin and metalloproteinase domain-containing protein 10 [Trichoplax sp. H2]